MGKNKKNSERATNRSGESQNLGNDGKNNAQAVGRQSGSSPK